MKLRLLSLVLVTACGNVVANPIDGGNSPIDAPTGSTGNPSSITISGSVDDLSIGEATSVAGVTLSAFAASNENTPLATATSDAQGAYTMTLSTVIPFDGFIKASKSGLV